MTEVVSHTTLDTHTGMRVRDVLVRVVKRDSPLSFTGASVVDATIYRAAGLLVLRDDARSHSPVDSAGEQENPTL
jgi:hypothetical protein